MKNPIHPQSARRPVRAVIVAVTSTIVALNVMAAPATTVVAAAQDSQLEVPSFTQSSASAQYLVRVDTTLIQVEALRNVLERAGSPITNSFDDFGIIVTQLNLEQVDSLRLTNGVLAVDLDREVSVDGNEVGSIIDESATPGPIEGRYIVTVSSSASATARASIVSAFGDGVIATYSHAINGYAVQLTDDEVKTVKSLPGVIGIENDAIITLDATNLLPAATQTNPPWGLDRIDQSTLPLSRSYTAPSDGAGVTAYVIDTGVAPHAEFGSRLQAGRRYYNAGWDWLPWITWDTNTDDCNGHGTHVAGTIAGTTYGVAKAASVVPVRVFDCSGSTATSIIIDAIDWVVSNHRAGVPAVANLSLGGGASSALDAAVRSMVNDGIVVAVAAGNSNQNACYTSPARETMAFTVAASTSTDARASFSNFGPCVDLFAPGLWIQSAWPSDVYPYTSSRTISGTSMASPHVAGAAAAIWGEDLTASAVSVSETLGRSFTADKITDPGTGTLNRMLTLASGVGSAPDAPQTPSATVSNETVTVTWLAADNAATSEVTAYTVTAHDEAGGTSTACIWSSGPLECSTSGLAPGNWTFTVTASNRWGESAASPVSNVVRVALSNDFWVGATPLLGLSGVLSANNSSATLEPNEPSLGYGYGGASLWFAYTPTSNGSLTVNTRGSNFDTVLAVFSGAQLANLSRLAINDDYRFETNYSLQSQVTVTLAAGQTYWIRVHSYGSSRGDVVLNWSLESACTERVVANDDFCAAVELIAGDEPAIVNASLATTETGEPGIGSHSLWYMYTAPADGTLTITRADEISSVIEVYKGDTLSSLQPDSRWLTLSGTSPRSGTMQTSAGETYRIRRALDTAASGSISTSLSFVPTPTFTVPSRPTSLSVRDGAHGSVIVSWQPPTNDGGTPITSYDVTTQPEAGTCEADSTTLTCTLDGLSAWTRYTVAVTARNAVGQSVARSQTFVPGNMNDSFSSASQLADGNSGTTYSSNNFATAEYGEPAHVYGPYHSMWFIIDVPGSGALHLSTAGSNFDTTMAVYRGSTFATLSKVAQNDDATGTVTSAVDGYNGRQGAITLNWEFVAAAPPASPQNVSALATGVNSAVVTWSPPSSSLPITSTTVTAHPGGATCASTTSNQCEVTGLVTGGIYTFTAQSSNSAGTGSASAPSESMIVGSSSGARVSFPTSWGQDRIDQRSLPLDGRYETVNRGAGAVIFVVDSGVSAHDEFGARRLDGYDVVRDGYGTSDCHGHGTHVASTAAGATVGVASDAFIVPVRVLDCGGAGSISEVIAGLNWIRNYDLGSRRGVINLSLGGQAESSLDYVVSQVVADGFVVTVAAGNEAQDACGVSPARESSAITVAATTTQDERTWFSNFGSCVDLFAPGSSIIGAGITSQHARTTMSGTSMASPHAAGAAAIVLTAYPELSAPGVEQLLVSEGTHDVVSDPGANSPNVLLMVAGESLPPTDTPSAPKDVEAVVDASSITISWTPGAAAIVPVASFTATGTPEGTCVTQAESLTARHSCTILGLNSDIEYSFSVVAVNAAGVASAASTPVVASPDARFGQPVSDENVSTDPDSSTSLPSLGTSAKVITPIAPTRIVDTRSHPGARSSGGWVGGDRVLEVTIADALDIDIAKVSAVAATITVTNTVGTPSNGYLTVFPCGTTMPSTSNLNFVTGQTIANSVIAALADDGGLCVYVHGRADVLIDVTGTVAKDAGFTALTPARRIDTRSSRTTTHPTQISNSELAVLMLGESGVPASGVAAVAINLTLTNTSAPRGGYATVYPCGTSAPNTSNLNFVTGQTVANSVIAPLSNDGRLCVAVHGSADVIIDVNGVFLSASNYTALPPTRAMDTRSSGRLGDIGNTSNDMKINLSDHLGVAADSLDMVSFNLTATSTRTSTGGGYVTIYQCDALPQVSQLNFKDAQTVANSVIAATNANGEICVHVHGEADVLIDVNGFTSK